MAIFHVVQFEFDPETSDSQIEEVCNGFIALKTECLHPTTSKPYIKSVVGGKNTSPEGLNNGISHAFVMELENEEDRKYYLESDPNHKAFGRMALAVTKKLIVVDFTSGKF